MKPGFRWSDRSLTQRVFLGAAAWSVVVLAGVAFALSAVYRAQTLSLLDEDLEETLVTLARAVDVDEDGGIVADPNALPTDRRYRTPLSGRYWAVAGVAEDGGLEADDIRPQSLWDGAPPLPNATPSEIAATPGAVRFGDAEGPNGERVRAAAQSIIVQERDRPILLIAAADRSQADRSATRFLLLLLGALAVLGVSLLAALWGSLRLALRPLSAIEADVADVREGRKTKLSDDYPAEVRPLSEELNKLVDHNRDVVERARTHVGNLAHALKTPIAVMMNEAKGETALDQVVRRQAQAMNDNVQHYLKRAQAAARAQAIGARCEVGPVVEDLTRLLNRLFAEKGVTVTADGGAGAVFRGERQDLEEMLGNLMENACKFAKGEVRVATRVDGGAILIHVDDDGPGLSPEERAEALKRGVRLDERAPGTGLGLSIVAELADMHSGVFDLSDSPLGGLRATLKLNKA